MVIKAQSPLEEEPRNNLACRVNGLRGEGVQGARQREPWLVIVRGEMP
jgi:hypothetical protein